MAFDWQQVTLVIVPGLGGSGPEHWQSRWERAYPRSRRVTQRDWDNPVLQEWVGALERTLAAVPGPVVLVGHSAGCLTIVHWAAGGSRRVDAALLVAPPDWEAEGRSFPGWTPLPRVRLPFASLVVASANDPYATLSKSAEMAQAWGARIVSVGEAGHINPASGFGPWPQGERILEELAAQTITRQ